MIKSVKELIKEIEERGPIEVPEGCVTGEEYEKWLYEEDKPEIENKTK